MEKIDIGNGEIREIQSGLVEFYTLDQMIGATVVVICNLKPRNIAGKMSNGMVMCAETPTKSACEFLQPPEGSVAGDLVFFEGFDRQPPAELPGKRWQTNAEKFFIRED